MRRMLVSFVIVALLGIGTGALDFLHHLEDHHDESQCVIHAIFGSPVIADGHVPLLISVGLLVAFLTLLTQLPTLHQPHSRIGCRGPPARG